MTLEELRLAHRLHVAEVDGACRAAFEAAEANGTPIVCRSGCSACCNLKVEIGALEALAVADLLRAQGRAGRAMRNRLANAGRVMAASAPEAYWHMRRPCALLAADGSCSVYEARPVACRLHQSIGGDCAAMQATRVETGHVLREHAAFCVETAAQPALAGWPALGALPAMVAAALAKRP